MAKNVWNNLNCRLGSYYAAVACYYAGLVFMRE